MFDDGFENITLEKAILPNNYVRAYRLQNNDILTINNMVLEFEDNILYKVVDDGFDLFGQKKWKRTGKSFTPEQLNKLLVDGNS